MSEDEDCLFSASIALMHMLCQSQKVDRMYQVDALKDIACFLHNIWLKQGNEESNGDLIKTCEIF